ncbi:MAG: PEGA domain-containing protein [Fimbriimonadaceae bacterium]|nr:PEGA domain-containing protein [Fimbriimonadaceae bacterium]
MRPSRLLLLLPLLLLAGPAPAGQRKVTLYGFQTRGEGLRLAAAAANRAVVLALAALPETTASRLEPASGAAAPDRTWALGELSGKIAEVTAADLVLCGVLTRSGEQVLVSLTGYDAASRELHLSAALQLTRPTGRPSADWEQAVCQAALAAVTRWSWPSGSVSEVVEGPQGQVLRLRWTAGQAVLGATAAAWRRPAARLALQTGDRFAAPLEPLGAATLVRTEGSTAWLELPATPAVTAGETVVLAPLGAAVEEPPGVVLTSQPWGAVAAVDGRLRGVTPLWVPLAMAGETDLQLQHPDTTLWRRAVTSEVPPGGLLEALLTYGSGVSAPETTGLSISVDSRPAGAEVLLDGVPQGLTPVRLTGLRGRPLLLVRREGYLPWQMQLATSGPAAVVAELQPAFGGLAVSSRPAGAEVYVDGHRHGVTPLRLTGLPTGPHQVRLHGPAGRAVAREVTIAAGGEAQLEVDFSALEGPPAPPEDGAIPAPAAPLPGQLAVQGIAWQRKFNVAPASRLHLVAARLDRGGLLSCALAPVRSYYAEPVAGGFQITWRDLPVTLARELIGAVTLPEIRSIELRGDGQRLVVTVLTAPGVAVKVHDSSGLDRLRVVLLPPGPPAP